MQNEPLTPLLDDQCALKTQGVRIQDLSIKPTRASTNGSASPPPPAPIAESRAEQQSEPKLASSGALRSSPLKRKNKRMSSSPTAKKKTSLSDVVVAEGELVVAEEHTRDSVVLRTLGSIFCVLVVKNGTSLHLETVSDQRHHFLDLDVAAMDVLDQDALRDARKFKLQSRCASPGRPSAYIFECPTPATYAKWIDAIAGFRDRSDISSSSSSSSRRDAGASSSCQHTSEATGATRRMRSIASLCDQPAPHVQPALLPPCSSFLYAAPPKTKHVILVRHGHYINAHARGVPDSHQVLSQMGRQQAECTGTYLEQLYARAPTRHDITIFHSDMTRAVETAQTISKDFGHCMLRPTRLLREGWPGRPYATHEPQVASAAPAAELERIDAERMELAFQTFFSHIGCSSSGCGIDGNDCDDEEQFSYQVVVCHANLIRFFLCRAMGIDPTGRWGHFEINHCGVTRIDVSEHRPLKILSVNETGHLPHSLITSSEDHL